MPAAPIIRRHSSSASATGGTVDVQRGRRDSDITTTTNSNTSTNSTSTTNRSTLQRVVSSQHSLKRVDSPAVLRAESDKAFQVSPSGLDRGGGLLCRLIAVAI